MRSVEAATSDGRKGVSSLCPQSRGCKTETAASQDSTGQRGLYWQVEDAASRCTEATSGGRVGGARAGEATCDVRRRSRRQPDLFSRLPDGRRRAYGRPCCRREAAGGWEDSSMRWRCLMKAGQLLMEVGGRSCSDVQAATVGWSRGSAPKRTTRSGLDSERRDRKPTAPNVMEMGVAPRGDGPGVEGGLVEWRAGRLSSDLWRRRRGRRSMSIWRRQKSTSSDGQKQSAQGTLDTGQRSKREWSLLVC